MIIKKMRIFLQWIVPIIVLIASLIVTIQLTPTQKTQVITPLLAGVIIFSLKSFQGMPDVILQMSSTEMTYLRPGYGGEMRFHIRAMLVNRSATGTGELRGITLKIPLGNLQYLDIPVMRGEPDITGFRFQSHGVFPDKMLAFETAQLPTNLVDLSGQKAEIHLDVVGQRMKKYKITVK